MSMQCPVILDGYSFNEIIVYCTHHPSFCMACLSSHPISLDIGQLPGRYYTSFTAKQRDILASVSSSASWYLLFALILHDPSCNTYYSFVIAM